jgi:hypothetical protein
MTLCMPQIGAKWAQRCGPSSTNYGGGGWGHRVPALPYASHVVRAFMPQRPVAIRLRSRVVVAGAIKIRLSVVAPVAMVSEYWSTCRVMAL